MYVMLLVPILAADVAQEAMRKFLESKGVLAVKDYYPDDPEDQHVRAYEKHGFFGPDLDAPRICQSQTFKGKWNKQVVDMLTAAFISAVQQGDYNPVQHSWQQMKEDEVRKKCQSKLYRTQYVCRERRKSPMLDKVNRMRQRRQEVCLLACSSRCSSSDAPYYCRRTTEGGRSTT